MPTESDLGKEIAELRDRTARLEVRIEEINKRLDGFAKYMKELYDYLKQQNKTLF